MGDDVSRDKLTRRPILDSGLAQIQRALAQLPPGKRAAIVAVADEDGIHFGAAARINDDWQLAAELEKLAGQKPNWQVSVRWAK